MEFIGGFIGIALVLAFALLIGLLRVLIESQDWMVAEIKRRRKKDVTLIVYRAGELYGVKYLTIKAAAQGALESEVYPYCIVANGETVWQASEVDSVKLTLEKLAR
jgi:hypothetical protein